MTPKKFAIIGGAGYVAPKHVEAIYQTGNQLIAVIDPNDNLEYLDRFFPEAEYFQDLEAFSSWYVNNKKLGNTIDYMVVCSPTDLHFEHCKRSIQLGIHVICESPTMLTNDHLKELTELETKTGYQITPFLQYRVHPSFSEVQKQLQSKDDQTRSKITLTNITARGKWYQKSWKGTPARSGGLTTIFGFHYFEWLQALFGEITGGRTEHLSQDQARGTLQLERATVHYFLSTDENDLPKGANSTANTKFLELLIDDKKINLDKNDELFKYCYQVILNNQMPRIHSLNALIKYLENNNE